MVRFGIEEEFMTLDPRTLAPIPQGAAARTALARDRLQSANGQRPAGDVQKEFLDCQVEIATAPSQTLEEAGAQLARYRAQLRDFGRRAGLIVASAGTPYGIAANASVTDTQRYRMIADFLGGLTREHLVNGLHVHTEVIGVEEQVSALNAVRPWLPVLLAATANAPFWRGQDSGFASWRSMLLRRLPTMWCPPVFQDAQDYQHRVERLVTLGAALDPASIAWAARVSDTYDTVEVRVFDAQLTVADSLFTAALTRAIITDRPRTVALDSEAIDASLWMAARGGMRARVVDPITGDVSPVPAVLQALCETVRNALEGHGDLEFARSRIERAQAEGSGADRQRRAVASGGALGLAGLLVDLDNEPPAPRETDLVRAPAPG
ncbi:YbdK family carboxylate-amine ligase [Microbacterium sp. NPDC077644]|uniref:carboxylate-amine ligase n=1 Tax=Microbacterium sp. NPDC077644 TaxID=3155055 RepID=UPI00344DB4C9